MKSTSIQSAFAAVCVALLIAAAPQAAGQDAPGDGDRYGSIAVSQEPGGGHAWGIAWSYGRLSNATSRALGECQSQGGGNCQQVGWFRNACGALAVGGGNGFGAGWGDTMASAERDALAQCGNANDGCQVLIGRCAEPDAQEIETGDVDAYTGSTPGDEFRDCAGCPEMVVIPAGSFQMGCMTPTEFGICPSIELPVHDVTIPQAFAVSKHEVTFEEWDTCVAGGGCGGYSPDDQGWGRGRRPVVDVSWEDAREYAAWLSRRTGRTYSLLSEAEWEYVARAGSTTRYNWGNGIGTNRANCQNHLDPELYDGCGDQWDTTAPVGSFPANAFGVHDMHGNVSEWVEDCWNESYLGAPSRGGAWRSGDCENRVLRGGSWGYYPRFLRSANRNWDATGNRKYFIGFRVARTLTP